MSVSHRTTVHLEVEIVVDSDRGILAYPDRMKNILERAVQRELLDLSANHVSVEATVTLVTNIIGTSPTRSEPT